MALDWIKKTTYNCTFFFNHHVWMLLLSHRSMRFFHSMCCSISVTLKQNVEMLSRTLHNSVCDVTQIGACHLTERPVVQWLSVRLGSDDRRSKQETLVGWSGWNSPEILKSWSQNKTLKTISEGLLLLKTMLHLFTIYIIYRLSVWGASLPPVERKLKEKRS